MVIKTSCKQVTIMHIISADQWAGAESQAYNCVADLKEKGLNILCVLFNDGILAKRLREHSIPVYIIDENTHNSLRIIIKIHKLIKIFRPLIIHTHKTKEHFIAAISTLFFRNRPKIIRTIHGSTSIWSWNNLSLYRTIRGNLYITVEKILVKFFVNYVILVTHDLKDSLTYLKRNKVKVIHNCLNFKNMPIINYDNSIRKKFKTENLFWIGTTTRLVEIKNLPILIMAARLLKDRNYNFKISIFGNGPLRENLCLMIKEYQLEANVELHGFIKEIHPILNELDLFVLCSRHEGMPMALIEAMYYQKPVICTKVGGMAEIISDGNNGLLVKPDDPIALANAIDTLFNNPNLANNIALNAKNTIIKNYDSKIYGNKLIDLYLSILT